MLSFKLFCQCCSSSILTSRFVSVSMLDDNLPELPVLADGKYVVRPLNLKEVDVVEDEMVTGQKLTSEGWEECLPEPYASTTITVGGSMRLEVKVEYKDGELTSIETTIGAGKHDVFCSLSTTPGGIVWHSVGDSLPSYNCWDDVNNRAELVVINTEDFDAFVADPNYIWRAAQ